MAYKVKITYKGIVDEAARLVAPICRIMAPTTSYIDTPVYREGHPVGQEEKVYGESVYATNVDGAGFIETAEPFNTPSFPFPVPLAQFKVAMVATEKDEHDNPYVEFDVEDYKEAFYYKQVGFALADQGFEVTVTATGAGVGA